MLVNDRGCVDKTHVGGRVVTVKTLFFSIRVWTVFKNVEPSRVSFPFWYESESPPGPNTLILPVKIIIVTNGYNFDESLHIVEIYIYLPHFKLFKESISYFCK